MDHLPLSQARALNCNFPALTPPSPPFVFDLRQPHAQGGGYSPATNYLGFEKLSYICPKNAIDVSYPIDTITRQRGVRTITSESTINSFFFDTQRTCYTFHDWTSRQVRGCSELWKKLNCTPAACHEANTPDQRVTAPGLETWYPWITTSSIIPLPPPLRGQRVIFHVSPMY